MSLLDPFRRAVPKALKERIKTRLGIPLTRLHDDWKMLAPIGPVYRRHVILDVGAHEGWFFHCWKDWCPEAEVHAFEPAPEAFANVTRAYGRHPGVTINNVGVAREPGTLELNLMSESAVSNSFLRPVEATWDEVQYRAGTITTKTVPVTTLDAYCSEKGIESVYLIKIDVQGFELEVLKGAKETLKITDYVFVESAIRPLYEQAPRFTDVYAHMDHHGFHLIGMRAWHRGNQTLMESDMLFRRNDLMPEIDPSVDRIVGDLTGV
jgi:FkbM family methyltransferase